MKMSISCTTQVSLNKSVAILVTAVLFPVLTGVKAYQQLKCAVIRPDNEGLPIVDFKDDDSFGTWRKGYWQRPVEGEWYNFKFVKDHSNQEDAKMAWFRSTVTFTSKQPENSVTDKRALGSKDIPAVYVKDMQVLGNGNVDPASLGKLILPHLQRFEITGDSHFVTFQKNWEYQHAKALRAANGVYSPKTKKEVDRQTARVVSHGTHETPFIFKVPVHGHDGTVAVGCSIERFLKCRLTSEGLAKLKTRQSEEVAKLKAELDGWYSYVPFFGSALGDSYGIDVFLSVDLDVPYQASSVNNDEEITDVLPPRILLTKVKNSDPLKFYDFSLPDGLNGNKVQDFATGGVVLGNWHCHIPTEDLVDGSPQQNVSNTKLVSDEEKNVSGKSGEEKNPLVSLDEQEEAKSKQVSNTKLASDEENNLSGKSGEEKNSAVSLDEQEEAKSKQVSNTKLASDEENNVSGKSGEENSQSPKDTGENSTSNNDSNDNKGKNKPNSKSNCCCNVVLVCFGVFALGLFGFAVAYCSGLVCGNRKIAEEGAGEEEEQYNDDDHYHDEDNREDDSSSDSSDYGDEFNHNYGDNNHNNNYNNDAASPGDEGCGEW